MVKLCTTPFNSFAVYGDFQKAAPFGGGHINDTVVSVWNQAGREVRYLHQRINTKVFTRPDWVMENIEKVTRHIAKKLHREGAPDISRRVLSIVPTLDGNLTALDGEGGVWRTFLFIENSVTKDNADSPAEAFALGQSIGRFHNQLADLDAASLHETIPDFHNMEKRYEQFYAALEKNAAGCAVEVKAEIDFMRQNEKRGAILVEGLSEGILPLRVTHNDTKMNNILLDADSAQALCVADLDTVMPGSALFDIGDLIRTVCTTAAEDETDLSKVTFSPAYFAALIEGYYKEAKVFVTDEEARLILEAGRNLTHIMALRFLTDYIAGDVYYKINRPSQNIDRARNQIALIRSIDAFWKEAENIAAEIVKK